MLGASFSVGMTTSVRAPNAAGSAGSGTTVTSMAALRRAGVCVVSSPMMSATMTRGPYTSAMRTVSGSCVNGWRSTS